MAVAQGLLNGLGVIRMREELHRLDTEIAVGTQGLGRQMERIEIEAADDELILPVGLLPGRIVHQVIGHEAGLGQGEAMAEHAQQDCHVTAAQGARMVLRLVARPFRVRRVQIHHLRHVVRELLGQVQLTVTSPLVGRFHRACDGKIDAVAARALIQDWRLFLAEIDLQHRLLGRGLPKEAGDQRQRGHGLESHPRREAISNLFHGGISQSCRPCKNSLADSCPSRGITSWQTKCQQHPRFCWKRCKFLAFQALTVENQKEMESGSAAGLLSTGDKLFHDDNAGIQSQRNGFITSLCTPVGRYARCCEHHQDRGAPIPRSRDRGAAAPR